MDRPAWQRRSAVERHGAVKDRNCTLTPVIGWMV
jgi:hypothetical protein